MVRRATPRRNRAYRAGLAGLPMAVRLPVAAAAAIGSEANLLPGRSAARRCANRLLQVRCCSAESLADVTLRRRSFALAAGDGGPSTRSSTQAGLGQ
jgi:hypothetical protein